MDAKNKRPQKLPHEKDADTWASEILRNHRLGPPPSITNPQE
jgi:hypothetical protein